MEEPEIRQSLFDRLLDEFPDEDRDAPRSRARQIADVRNAARRDLENLFNTRQRWVALPETLEELGQSLVAYGMPDIQNLTLSSEDHRDRLRRMIADTVRRALPIFEQVELTLLENSDPLDRVLRFRITALIRIELAGEALVFDSVLDPSTYNFSVKDAGRV